MIRRITMLIVLMGALVGLVGATALTAAPAMASTTCTAQLGQNCGPYQWSGWPGSNGFNTYVSNQDLGAGNNGGTGTLTATSPSSWTATADYNGCGGCVQSYVAVGQLTNNWSNGGFNGGGDLPLSVLKKLQVTYTESMPSDPANPTANQAEFSPDIWTDYAGQKGSGSGDIMMWADTTGERCDDNGLNASNIIGQAVLAGQHWTAYSFGPGQEIIFVLDGIGDDGTVSTDPVDQTIVVNGQSIPACAQQKSGTLHVLAALKWLANNHVAMMPSFASNHLGNFDAGYEITAGDGTGQYAVTRLKFPVAFKK